MNKTPVQREFFLDSIRAWLMLLGIPFHLSLIYSAHHWHVNSADPSFWLTLFNDSIHAFRMQVFFVISGYFSYMLFLRYPPKHWWLVRIERVAIPMLTAIPLLTLPQFLMLHYLNDSRGSWKSLSAYEKFNTLVWELISHLWFLFVLVILTTAGLILFQFLKKRKSLHISAATIDTLTLGKLTLIFFVLGLIYAAFRRAVFIATPELLSDGLFNFVVMQTLFYLPFFTLGALTFKHPSLKQLFTRPTPWCHLCAAIGLVLYMLNLHLGNGDTTWMYEIDSIITMMLGLWMVNVVFSLGHRLLNTHSDWVNYFVNASLFIYLVHHPLTLVFGGYITPHIQSDTLGFIAGLVFVIGTALALYEIHLRIPMLRFLFSGKPQPKTSAGTSVTA